MPFQDVRVYQAVNTLPGPLPNIGNSIAVRGIWLPYVYAHALLS